jgi:hypothetical protein
MFGREPALILGALQSLLAAAIAFGANLSADQTAVLLGASAAVLALITRSKVSPVSV